MLNQVLRKPIWNVWIDLFRIMVEGLVLGRRLVRLSDIWICIGKFVKNINWISFWTNSILMKFRITIMVLIWSILLILRLLLIRLWPNCMEKQYRNQNNNKSNNNNNNNKKHKTTTSPTKKHVKKTNKTNRHPYLLQCLNQNESLNLKCNSLQNCNSWYQNVIAKMIIIQNCIKIIRLRLLFSMRTSMMILLIIRKDLCSKIIISKNRILLMPAVGRSLIAKWKSCILLKVIVMYKGRGVRALCILRMASMKERKKLNMSLLNQHKQKQY